MPCWKGKTIMHEISLMDGILKIAEASLKPYQVERVNNLTVQAGVLANIMPGAFAFAFEALSQGTIFAGAELIVEKLPIEARCLECGKVFKSESIPLICPQCSSTNVEVISGSEVNLTSIDFEEEGKNNEN